MKRNALEGKRFNRLVVYEVFETDPRKNLRWLCICDCGGIAVAYAYDLNSGRVQSCGCKKQEGLHRTHGMARQGSKRSPMYSVWAAMLQRCSNPNDRSYKHYGSRGIRVCQKWSQFEGFLHDMGSTYQKGLSLERIDNDIGYSKTNCIWADTNIQSRNKRNNIWVEVSKELLILCDALKKIGMSKSTYYYYHKTNNNFTPQEVIDTWLLQKSL